MVFSLWELLEKCSKQRQSLFIDIINLTKVSDLVSRDGLFKFLPKISCLPRLLSISRSFHDNMKGTVVFGNSTSNTFDIQSGLKQSRVLAPALFEIFFAVMLKHAFRPTTENIYLLNLFRLRAKSKV